MCGDDVISSWNITGPINHNWKANDPHDLKNGMTIKPSHAIKVDPAHSETTENTTFTFTAPYNIAITGVQFKNGSDNVAATRTSEPGPTFTVTLPAETTFTGFEVTYGYIKGSCGSSATWELSKQNGQYTTLTIGGSGDMQDYGRTTVDGLWRTDAPWDWQDLKSVSIGNSITSIGDYAFCGCQQLSSITIGWSVTNIGYASINHCDGITEVTLPASVASIEQGAFENSIHLDRVNIQKSDGLVTNANAFNGTALQYIVVPTLDLALQYKTATNWSALASKLRVPLGNNLFAATDEGGTAAYAITNDTDLRNLATIVNATNGIASGKTFRQTSNITLTGNFTPIGYNNNSFSGTYDGGNYTISGLNVTDYYNFVGLVGALQGGTMKNVHLISPKCTSSNWARVGTIVGKTYNARVENCWVINPTVSASDPDSYFGAIIGQSNHKDDVLTNLYVYDNHGYKVIGNYDSQHITRVCRARKVTVGSGLGSVTPAANNMDYGFIYNNEKYYREGLQLTLNSNLSAGTGQHIVYKSNGNTLGSNSFNVGSSDVTLTSELVYNTYTVQFNANAGTGTMDSQAFTYGTAQALTANAFTRTGYTFAGWATTANGEVVYTNQQSVNNLTPTNGGTVTLFAKWNTITYDISYNLAGGTVATANNTTYNIETATFTLNNPTRTGYTFAGWTGSNGTTPQTEVVITQGNINALHYEAHWTAHQYAVHFNGNDNTGGAMDDQDFTYDKAQELTANGFTRAYTVTFDYNEATGGNDDAAATATATFNGWATTADGEVAYSDQQSVSNLTADDGGTANLFANWTKSSITLPTPTRTGYTFAGWYSDAELSASIGAAGDSYTPSADITLYAKWTAHTYAVRFNGNGNTGGSMDDQDFTYDKAQELTANGFTRAYTVTYNYNEATGGNDYATATATATFNGWATTADGEVAYSDQQSVSNFTADDGGTVDLFANWTKSSITLPTPTRTGYTFAGWYSDAGLSASIGAAGASYTPSADITLYAKWTAHTYAVRFNGNGNTGGSMDDQDFTYDKAQELTANGFTRAYTVTYNYNEATGGNDNATATATATFNGWATTADGVVAYSDQQSVSNFTADDGGTVNLFAYWTKNSITLPTPTRTGYTFGGWYSDAELSTSIGAAGDSYTPSADITLYAKWTAHTYAVRFNGNGNTGGSMDDQNFTYDKAQELTANAFTRAYTVTYNYNGATGGNDDPTATATATFNGWATTADGQVAYSDQQSVSNLTADDGGTVDLFANWTKSSITLPTPTRTGYTFAGWYSDAELSASIGAAGASYTPSADITLYAKWTAHTYAVRFNGNGNTGGSMDDQDFTYDKAQKLTANGFTRAYTVTFDYNEATGGNDDATATATATFNGWATTADGEVAYSDQQSVSNLTADDGGTANLFANWTKNSITLPTPTRTGYTFGGWYSDAGLSASIGAAGAAYTPSADITLYAKWNIITYNISYDLAGGTVATANNTTYNIETATFTLNNPTRTGYTFTGWTGSNGDTPQTKVVITQGNINDLHYTANWNIITYNIEYNLDGGTVATANPTTYNIETATFTLNNPTRTGYTFAGWTGSNGTTPQTEVVITQGNINALHYEAHWNIITYNIEYNLDGGTVATANPITYNVETVTFTLNNPTRTGYTFAGWTGSNGDTPQTKVVINQGNINALHYEAHWTAHQYAVHFNGNGNTGGSMDNQTFTYNKAQKLTANAFTRAYTVTYNYNGATGGNDDATATATATFNGWATTAYGEVAYSDQQSVSNLTADDGGTVNLFANWTKNSITLPTPIRTGYTFGGWYSDAELSASIGAAGASYTPSADIKLYAKWNIITYNISYDLAGGTVAKANPTTYNIETATFTLTNPTKPGYTFTGWTKGNDNTLLTTVTIEQGSIGNLTYTAHYEVYLHNITIGDLTYRNTSATEAKVTACNSSSVASVTIPATVTDNGVTYSVSAIDANAFSGCTSLTNIIMQPTTPPALGTGAFNACTALAYIAVPAGTDATYKAAANWSAYEDKILGIHGTCGNGVYWSYNNTSKTLAIFGMGAMENYKYWNTRWFDYQEITKVVISDGVTSIGENAFFECSALTSITIPASVTSIGEWAFRDCHALTSITIPASVTSIGENAISRCRSLASITVAAGNTVYDSRNNCNALIETASNTLIVGSHNTVIPNTVTNISNEAFATYSALTSITIPASVTSIGDNVFDGCESLTAVMMQSATPPTLNQWVFDSCPALTIYVPTGTAAAYKAAENWSSYKERIEEFDGTCGDGVYWSYNSDSKALTIFGTGAMTNGQPWESYRKDINTVLVGNGVTTIGNNAFKGCTALSTVVMPATTPPTLGSGAFIDCNALTGIYVPEDKVDDYKDAWSDYADKIMAIDGTCGKNVYYSYQSNSNTLTIFGTGPMTSYNDNSYFPWYTYIKNITSVTIKSGVTTIGNNAFNWCTGLTSIDIPASVTSIGENAFGNCSALTSIDIPASVTTIGFSAFGGCAGLTSIDIPASVTTIGNNAFGGCVGLTAFTVDNGNTAYASEDGVLFNKDKTTLVRCPIGNNRTTYTIPASVTTISEEAFRGCSGLTEVTIPATVTSIGYCAFYGCRNLKTFIAQPTTPPTLGYEVFGNGNGINIYVAADKADAYKSAWSAYADRIQAIGGTCGEGVYWSYNSDSKKLNIFGSGAMADYTSGNQPWAAHLAEVTKVVIDRKVTTIGKNAFRGCTNLTTLMSLATTPLTLGSDALTGCTDLAHIYVPISIESTYKTVAGWSDYASLIRGFNDTCGEDVLWAYDNGTLTVFGSGNMANNRNSWLDSGFDITKAVIEEGVTSINQSAFSGCTSVTSIDIPASVTSIGSNAFALCTSLTSIDIPASVTSIGDGAFYECTSLTTVTFAENSQFTTINSFTFNGCSALTSITIPASVTSIVGNAFYQCTSLEYISVAGGNTRYDSRNNCNALIETASNTLILGSKNTVIPNTVTNIGDGAFENRLVLTSITIPASVNSIAYNAFYGCTGLESISVAGGNTRYDSRNNCNAIIETATNTLIQGCKNTVIPNTVTTIDNWAFNGCSTLTSIDIPASVTSIVGNAFYQCTSLEYISVAGGNTRYDSRNNCNAIIETASNTLIFGSKNTVIPNTVTNIGGLAFYCSTVLTSITIPASVTTIEQGAFDKCTALTTVFMQATTPPMIFGKIFDNCNALTVIYVPTGTAATYKADSHFSKYKDIIKEMSEITLADNASNSDLITMTNGLTLNVTLQGRTLYKDGAWNTLCLPFDVTLEGSPLEGATVMKLTTSTSNLTDGTLTLNFEDETATMTAGTPYIIKWTKDEGYDAADPDTRDLKNPVFTGVIIDKTMNDVNTSDGKVTFRGNYDAQSFDAEDKSILLVGGNNLYWPQAGASIKACRSYFQLNDVNGVREFRLNFGEEKMTEISLTPDPSRGGEGSSYWYSLDGHKLNEKPTTKGIYVNRGRKIVVK